MLFKFKSKATADLIMLEADARRLLKIMLGDDPVKGIIRPPELPAVLARLQTAVAEEEVMRQVRAEQVAASTDGSRDVHAPELPAIRLAQRAAPMQQMLQRCIKEESDIVWGV